MLDTYKSDIDDSAEKTLVCCFLISRIPEF